MQTDLNSNSTVENVNMSERQAPLYERYAQDPQSAWTRDYATTSSRLTPATDPLQSDLTLTYAQDTCLKVGVHCAVGGRSDYPTPGDILCGAIASCLDSTIRIIANRFDIKLVALSVEVIGEVDVRGTLRASDDCPVGFQNFQTHVDIQVPDEVDEKLVQQLIKAAEYSCVILQTLRGVPLTPVTASINQAELMAITP